MLVLATAAGAGAVAGRGDDDPRAGGATRATVTRAGGSTREATVTRAGGSTREATVTRVVDGDTAILSTLGRSRFIGVDTPEVYGRRECFGAQASAFAKRALSGQRVRYAIGVEPRDRYGRALVYLWRRDGRLFNEQLVAGGYARPLAIAPNLRYAGLLRRRAQDARAAARGLWSRKACP